ncbi:MAG: hypothetical protein H6744_14600 [Deltaproteobacteria bacterium]|nr:hypothetical protein [Deltaproteobacteria bacterium]
MTATRAVWRLLLLLSLSAAAGLSPLASARADDAQLEVTPDGPEGLEPLPDALDRAPDLPASTQPPLPRLAASLPEAELALVAENRGTVPAPGMRRRHARASTGRFAPSEVATRDRTRPRAQPIRRGPGQLRVGGASADDDPSANA